MAAEQGWNWTAIASFVALGIAVFNALHAERRDARAAEKRRQAKLELLDWWIDDCLASVKAVSDEAGTFPRGGQGLSTNVQGAFGQLGRKRLDAAGTEGLEAQEINALLAAERALEKVRSISEHAASGDVWALTADATTRLNAARTQIRMSLPSSRSRIGSEPPAGGSS